MTKNNKFYCTTPIYYVNAQPHLGTLYTTIIADVAARWNRMRGKAAFFLTGTDEHGQKIAEKASLMGKQPKEFVDSMIPMFKEVWKKFGIQYDHFIRTTDAEHEQAVVELLNRLIASDDIYKSTYVGLYCIPDETFVTHEQALEKDGQKLCPSCERELKQVEEESYFFRLSAYGDRLLEFYAQNPHFIHPKERLNEVIEFVKGGLRDLSISRKTVSWGIPFPGDPSHTVYVWGDALTNYISAIGFGNPARSAEMEKWWPADVHIMGKDIVRFHAVYWPAFLMAAQLPLPKKLLVHSYILVNDAKMSKSRGNAIDPVQLGERYGIESMRYYLMRYTSFAQDSSVSTEHMENVLNADLANSFGNLLNRVVSLALANGHSTVTPVEVLEAEGIVLRERARETTVAVCDEMMHYNYHLALSTVWKFVSDVNAYVHKAEPWRVVKTNKEHFNEIISVVCHSLYDVAVMLWPVMPEKMEQLLRCLGHSFTYIEGVDATEELRKKNWNKTFTLTASNGPLFPRIEPSVKEDVPAQKKETKMSDAPVEVQKVATIDDFAKLELRVGTITLCERVKGSAKMLRLEVDFGSFGQRQILSGIGQLTEPEKLVNVQAIFVVNFPERTMMGLKSQGMMLSAYDETNNFSPAQTGNHVENGSFVK